ELTPLGGQFTGGATVAFEELVSQVPLHRLDLRADGRLADAEPLGSLPEVAILGNGHEHFELSKRQSHGLPPSLTPGGWYMAALLKTCDMRRIAHCRVPWQPA